MAFSIPSGIDTCTHKRRLLRAQFQTAMTQSIMFKYCYTLHAKPNDKTVKKDELVGRNKNHNRISIKTTNIISQRNKRDIARPSASPWPFAAHVNKTQGERKKNENYLMDCNSETMFGPTAVTTSQDKVLQQKGTTTR